MSCLRGTFKLIMQRPGTDATGQYYRPYSVPVQSRSELRALPGNRFSVSSEWPPDFSVFRAQTPFPHNNNRYYLCAWQMNGNKKNHHVPFQRLDCRAGGWRLDRVSYLFRNGCCPRRNDIRAILEYRVKEHEIRVCRKQFNTKQHSRKLATLGVLLVIIVIGFLEDGLRQYTDKRSEIIYKRPCFNKIH